MLDKLKQRWELETNKDVWLVLLMFSLAGTTFSMLKKPLFSFFNISWGDNWLEHIQCVLIYIMFFMPLYQVGLLFWGFILRQWDFAIRFEKKIFKRFTYMALTAAIIYGLIWLFTK